MFLTRMALDQNRQETRELLGDMGQMQRVVRAAFAGGNMQPLFRTDLISSRLWLVILSRLRPSLAATHEAYGYPGVFPSWETFDYDETLEQASEGTAWHFELTASPMGIQPDPDPVWLEAYTLNRWLERQGEACGYELREARMLQSVWKQVGDACLLLACWDGLITIRDQEKFIWAVSGGIGSGRDLGAGLMTIAKAHTFWES